MHAGCTMLLGLQTILLGIMCRHGRQSGAQGKEPSRPWGPWPWRSRILLVFHRAQPTTASHLSESSPLTSPPWPDNCILPRKLGSWTLGVTPSQAALESIAFNRHQDSLFSPRTWDSAYLFLVVPWTCPCLLTIGLCPSPPISNPWMLLSKLSTSLCAP